MYKDFVPPVSIEEFAAYLDGNLTESGMEHVSSVISNSEYLGDIAEVSCSINDAIEQDLQEGDLLPSELSNMDFEIPDISGVFSEDLSLSEEDEFTAKNEEYDYQLIEGDTDDNLYNKTSTIQNNEDFMAITFNKNDEMQASVAARKVFGEDGFGPDGGLNPVIYQGNSYIRKEMKDVWEATIKKTHNWMIDETSGLVGVKTDEGVRKYLKRYFWGIKANVQKLVWFIYEHGSRGLKAIRQFLDNFIGFFTTDGYVVYKVYDDDELHPDQHRSACLTHIRRKFVESLEENHSLSMWFIDEIGRLFGIEHDCKKAGLTADQVLVERLQRSKPIMDRIKEKFERFARSNYKGLGALTKKALKYIKTEWSAMQTILQDGNLELSNNLAEQMMRHIKLNLKNCLNIGSENSALDYAFMFSVIESCNMNKLSPGCYIKELVSRLTAKPVCTAEKVALLPCFMQK